MQLKLLDSLVIITEHIILSKNKYKVSRSYAYPKLLNSTKYYDYSILIPLSYFVNDIDYSSFNIFRIVVGYSMINELNFNKGIRLESTIIYCIFMGINII